MHKFCETKFIEILIIFNIFSFSFNFFGSSLFSMGMVIFQFSRVGFREDIHTKQRRANFLNLQLIIKIIGELIMPEHQQIQQSKNPESTFRGRKNTISPIRNLNPAAIIQRAKVDPKSLTSADILQLQSTIGNRAVGRLLSEIRSSPAQHETIKRQEIPEEKEPLQGFFERKPEQEKCSSCNTASIQRKEENNTGMPDNLKAGIENLSGIDMSDVRVHYNSSKPAEVGALAYTQGTNIHVAPGQEQHLPHETWHVVQQTQGRVKPTMQQKGIAVNDDVILEREADVMGGKVQLFLESSPRQEITSKRVVQRVTVILTLK